VNLAGTYARSKVLKRLAYGVSSICFGGIGFVSSSAASLVLATAMARELLAFLGTGVLGL